MTLKGGSVISDEIALADAHPLGARPFKRPDYIRHPTLADRRDRADRAAIASSRRSRGLASLKAGELIDSPSRSIRTAGCGENSTHGIFRLGPRRTGLRSNAQPASDRGD